MKPIVNPRLTPWIAGVAVFAVITICAFKVESIELDRLRQGTELDVVKSLSSLRSQLETAFNKRVLIGRSLANFISRNPNLTYGEIEGPTRVLMEGDPSILQVRLVKREEIPFSDQIFPKDVSGSYPTPLVENFEALLMKVISNHKSVIAGPITLRESEKAFICITPIVETSESVNENHSRISGFVVLCY